MDGPAVEAVSGGSYEQSGESDGPTAPPNVVPGMPVDAAIASGTYGFPAASFAAVGGPEPAASVLPGLSASTSVPQHLPEASLSEYYYPQVPYAPGYGQYYAGVQPPMPYGTSSQPAVMPQGFAPPAAAQQRVALPSDLLEEEPVYVNAKQYHCIMRRRAQRAKAEAQNKLLKVRRPYLHRSRHEHAARRVRGASGRFLNAEEAKALAAAASEPSAGGDSPCSDSQPAKQPDAQPLPAQVVEQLEPGAEEPSIESLLEVLEGGPGSQIPSVPASQGPSLCPGTSPASSQAPAAPHLVMRVQ